MKTLLSAAAAALALVGTAAAQEAYVSGGIATDEDFNEFGFGARLGYDVSENFGFEGEASFFGFEEAGVDADIRVFGGFAKAGIPLGEGASLFGRVGYAGVNVDIDGFGDETEGAFAFGGGVEFDVTQSAGVRFDYTRLEGDDFEGGLISGHVVFRFGGMAQ